MKSKNDIVDYFKILSNDSGIGIECFLSNSGKEEIFDRLARIEDESISEVQLNQLFVLSGLHGFTFDFFSYYFLQTPDTHPYDVSKFDDYEADYKALDTIKSLKQLRWGMYRIYVDALLFFGNVNIGYDCLSQKNNPSLKDFFESKRFPTKKIMKRGSALGFESIPKEDRYLISEMACKTYEAKPSSENDLKKFLIDNYNAATKQGKTRISIKELLEGKYVLNVAESKQMEFNFASEDIIDDYVENVGDIEDKYDKIASKFSIARKKALKNTNYYLSLINDLDVYVATSMRTKVDFMEMATNTDNIFKDTRIKDLHLRYFDPTISAAKSHEDKGLIECLMVKCAKVLIYSAGFKESYGKDAEAAMALSTGKPVIFFCPDSNKANFYKKVHPLTKLVDFSTGVANGAMVTFDISQVILLLDRIFRNSMEYYIEQNDGYFRLYEKHTGSVIRIQTNDVLLSKSFWNFHQRFISK